MTTLGPMEIRPGTEADAPALVPMLAQLGYPTDPAAAADRLRHLLADRDAGLLLAETGGTPTAFLAYDLVHHLERSGPTLRITALVTDERHRRQGTAAALVTAVRELAEARGCDRLEVTSQPKRTDAHALYRGLDFEERPLRFMLHLH